MSTLAKVFVVLNLLLAAGFLYVTLVLYAKRVKYKERWDNQREAHVLDVQNRNERIEGLEGVKTDLTMKVESLNTQRKTLEKDVETLRLNNMMTLDRWMNAETQKQTLAGNLEDKDAELMRRHNQINTMHKVILKQQQALKVARNNERDAKNQMVELESQLNNVRNQLADVSRDKARIEKDLHHHNWIIEELLDAGIPVTEIVFGSRRMPQKAVEAQVLAVRRDVNLVMLSVGKDDGVKKGDKFTIFRDDKYIGKIEIETLFDDMCSGRILPELTREDIKQGDMANSRVY